MCQQSQPVRILFGSSSASTSPTDSAGQIIKYRSGYRNNRIFFFPLPRLLTLLLIFLPCHTNHITCLGFQPTPLRTVGERTEPGLQLLLPLLAFLPCLALSARSILFGSSMAEPDVRVPGWLKSLPLAPEYRPTETEFSDPIAFISRIEQEAAGFGICKVIPPLPKPPRKFVFSNINRSLSKSPESIPDLKTRSSDAATALFTTRCQELGLKTARNPAHKQVWQSGETYTLEQFEAKSKAFAKTQLGNGRDVSPLVMESLFWKATAEKPIYIEYANDVPGSGFGTPESFRRNSLCRSGRKRKFDCGRYNSVGGSANAISQESGKVTVDKPSSGSFTGSGEFEGSVGWKLSNSPWNLQVIAKAPGSLIRFMPDEVPGVTSPMVYIGMMFSWFAWHVEDHELHSLNFLHTGSPKTWYAVAGKYASEVESIACSDGYVGDVDRLAAFIMLGEKRTLFSPEVLVASGIPCCRLVQNPGEFVVTFPKAYHVGFSHGFNCGEAANFATAKWLNVARDAAVRRAAMSYLPMLSHQQLLYMLAVSFVSRLPRELLPGARSSRLRDRRKEEREYMVKRAFLDDMINERNILYNLLGKQSTIHAVYWDANMLHMSSIFDGEHSLTRFSASCEQPGLLITKEVVETELNESATVVEKTTQEFISTDDKKKVEQCNNVMVDQSSIYVVDDELPYGLDVNAGSLACVACGILGYPFMSILQPSERAAKELTAVDAVLDNPKKNKYHGCSYTNSRKKSNSVEVLKVDTEHLSNEDESEVIAVRKLQNDSMHHPIGYDSCCMVDPPSMSLSDDLSIPTHQSLLSSDHRIIDDPTVSAEGHKFVTAVDINNKDFINTPKEPEKDYNDIRECLDCLDDTSILDREDHIETHELHNTFVRGRSDDPVGTSDGLDVTWNTSNPLMRPRTFCLQHALEVQDLLKCKGGSNLLVICHSDYFKIKAQAMAVAEEIGIPFNSKDIPIGDASKGDLELINLSIDDDGHEEQGGDWSSKMGLNLQHCVKLWKHTSSKHEKLSLALSGLFSDRAPLSTTSGLKWHFRKSRTQGRVPSVKPCRFQVGTTKKEVRNTLSDASIKDQSIARDDFESSDVVMPIKTRVQPKRQSRRLFSNIGNEPMLVDKKKYIDKDRGLSVYITCTNTEFRNKIFGTSPTTTPRSFETCAESFEAFEVRGSESSDKVNPTVSDDFPVSVHLNVKNNGQSEVQPIIAVNNAENDQPLEGSEKQDDVCASVCPNDEFGNLPDSEDRNGMPLVLTETGCPMWSNNDGNSVEMIDSSKMMWDIQMKSDIKRDTYSDKNGELSTSPISDVTKYEMAMDALMDCGNSDTMTSAQGTVKILDVADSGIPNWNLIAEHNKNATVENHHSIVRPPLKFYTRRKRNEEKAGLASNVSKSADVVAHIECDFSSLKGGDEHADTADIHSLEKDRRKRKRRREIDQLKIDKHDFDGFVRSPCEGLRERKKRQTSNDLHDESREKKAVNVKTKKKSKSESVVVGQSKKSNSDGEYNCDLEGCRMRFETKEELGLHKRNMCTYEGCGKRFRKHRYAVRHQCVHIDERPLKCPWKGCTMSFKWAWARTEHLRVHTGERPYNCKVTGCGLTFRFVSDFSRHRRKTGHYVN